MPEPLFFDPSTGELISSSRGAAQPQARPSVAQDRGADVDAGRTGGFEDRIVDVLLKGSQAHKQDTLSAIEAGLSREWSAKVVAAVVSLALNADLRDRAMTLASKLGFRASVHGIIQAILRGPDQQAKLAVLGLAQRYGAQGAALADDIIPFLESSGAELADAACNALGSTGLTISSLKELSSLIRHKEARVRCACVRMLGLLGARGGAVSGLVMLRLDDPDAAVREAATSALPRIGFHPAALDEIGRLLNHASDTRRIDMLRILERFGSSAQASAVLIVPLLKSPGNEVRQAARNTLRIVGLGRECIKPISLLAHHPQHDIRSAALDLLEECAPAPESCSLALSLMADRDSFLRERAARIISRTGIPPAALPGLRKLLRDERDQVKIMALEALAKAGDASRPASHLVVERIEDASGEVASAAATAFVAMASVEECASDISRVLHNRRQDRRLLMLGCLRKMGVAAAPALPLVTASMGDADWPVRDAACEAFIAIGFHDTCLPEVRRLIEHQDRNYRLAIIKALGACGMNASAAEEFLSQRQGDIDAEVGRAARKALSAVRGG